MRVNRALQEASMKASVVCLCACLCAVTMVSSDRGGDEKLHVNDLGSDAEYLTLVHVIPPIMSCAGKAQKSKSGDKHGAQTLHSPSGSSQLSPLCG